MRLMEGVEQVLTNAVEGRAPTRGECISLLSLPEHSLEAAIVTATADVVSRRRFGNRAMLLGQIGIEIAPCPGNCKFCTFGEDHTTFDRVRLTMEEIVARAHAFADAGDLYALFLMTMHDFEFSSLLTTVEAVRKEIPCHTQIVVNIGDFDAVQAQELRAAGVNGAYHVCRLREGTDTSLDPAQRRKTFGAIRDAGLDFYYCCEPIGPGIPPRN
jgi:biotin synthase